MLKEIIGQRQNPGTPSGDSYSPSKSQGDSSHESHPSPSKSGIMSSSKNVLASDVEIKGTIKFSNDLIIDGSIEGEVISDGSLTIGENALVKGDIRTKSVTVFGKVDGNITVKEQCELKANAEIVGDIRAGTLSIEGGATFMGNSQVGKHASASASSPRDSSPKS